MNKEWDDEIIDHMTKRYSQSEVARLLQEYMEEQDESEERDGETI